MFYISFILHILLKLLKRRKAKVLLFVLPDILTSLSNQNVIVKILKNLNDILTS